MIKEKQKNMADCHAYPEIFSQNRKQLQGIGIDAEYDILYIH
jgi:hypothetical protein